MVQQFHHSAAEARGSGIEEFCGEKTSPARLVDTCQTHHQSLSLVPCHTPYCAQEFMFEAEGVILDPNVLKFAQLQQRAQVRSLTHRHCFLESCFLVLCCTVLCCTVLYCTVRPGHRAALIYSRFGLRKKKCLT